MARVSQTTPSGAPNHGRTAIDGAAEHGHEDMLQLLLNHYDGCEGLSVVCERAATYAKKEDHGEIASWLRQYPSLSTDGELFLNIGDIHVLAH